MKKLILFAGVWCVLQLSTLSEYLKVNSPNAQLSGIAQEAVSELADENYAALYNRFDNSMKSAMPASQLPDLWRSVTAQVGTFRSQSVTRQEKSGRHDVVFVSCRFIRASLDVEIVFNDKRQIAGLFFGPSSLLLPSPQETRAESHSVRENLVGVWKGSVYAGAFIGRFFTIPIKPSGFMEPLQFYRPIREMLRFRIPSYLKYFPLTPDTNEPPPCAEQADLGL